MISVVIDTNIIISATLSKNSTPDKALNYVIDNALLLISKDTYAELCEKLRGAKFDKYVSLETRLVFLEKLRSVAELIDIERKVTACRDVKDDKFLEVAVNGDADFLKKHT
jgi:putative PIN family toxin of toxin-antitoxin system